LPTLYRIGGVLGLTLRGLPPQTPPTETVPDLGLVRGRREAPQRPTTTSPTNAHAVDGQCWWRPEGRWYPHRPPPSPDCELVEPHLADSDFLASILDSIDTMAPTSTSSSTAPPPADGLLLLPSLFSFVLELGPESLCISTLEPCTRTRSVA